MANTSWKTVKFPVYISVPHKEGDTEENIIQRAMEAVQPKQLWDCINFEEGEVVGDDEVAITVDHFAAYHRYLESLGIAPGAKVYDIITTGFHPWPCLHSPTSKESVIADTFAKALDDEDMIWYDTDLMGWFTAPGLEGEYYTSMGNYRNCPDHDTMLMGLACWEDYINNLDSGGSEGELVTQVQAEYGAENWILHRYIYHGPEAIFIIYHIEHGDTM
jgi:hypothetical protein